MAADTDNSPAAESREEKKPFTAASSETPPVLTSIETLRGIVGELARGVMGDSDAADTLSQGPVVCGADAPAPRPSVAPEEDEGGGWSAPRTAQSLEPHARLAEAEQLLQELEQQPFEPVEAAEPFLPAAPSVPRGTCEPMPRTVCERGPEEQKGRTFPSRSERVTPTGEADAVLQPSSRRFRRTVGWTLAVLAVVLAGAAGFLLYWYLVPPAASAPPEVLFEGAREYMGRGRFQEAADAFLLFARSYPDHPKVSDAQFHAAFALDVLSSRSPESSRPLKERSLALFTQFLKDNPADPKRALAEILVDTLHVELAHYEDVVASLRDLLHQVDDPAIVLPVLRTLGRAYYTQGDYEGAETAYLQAAALPGNDSAFTDYCQLGRLYRTWAESTPDEDEKQEFEALAIEYWTKAAEAPGVDPLVSAEIRGQVTRPHDMAMPAPEPAPPASAIPSGMPQPDEPPAPAL